VCRKLHGSAFATYGDIPAESLRWTKGGEDVRRFQSAPGAVRAFCGRCGSVVPEDAGDGAFYVPLGALDDDPGSRPESHIFVASKAAWVEIVDGLEQFDENAPGYATPEVPERPRSAVGARQVGGSCLCGAVAYRVDGPLARMRNCHCRRCRKARSAAYATNAFVDPARFAFLRGEDRLASYELPEAERFTQVFCSECSSPQPLVRRTQGFVLIPAGSFDDDPGLRASEHIFVASKAPWFEIADAIPQYDAYPPT
jgi:hypothetical protein